jgi:ubiquinone/menaquinone biosynthesis C-methylase UbiE
MNSEDLYYIPQFEGFAQYYDKFMFKLVNYPAWVDYIIKIFNECNLQAQTLIDVACGTGIPSLLFAQKGYRIIGVDNSQPMLEKFKNKIEHTNYDIQLVHADIRNFTLPEKVDAAVSLYDSINYLLNREDLCSCFSCVFENLKPNGIFAFDMNTIYCLESFWGTRDTPRRVNDTYSIWSNSYDLEKRISTLKLTVFTDDGHSFVELHKERGYTEAEIKTALESIGFTNIKFYSHLTFSPPTEKTLRIMVIAQR